VAVLFKSFGFIVPKDILIIWLSNIMILSVPDEDYSRNTYLLQKPYLTDISVVHASVTQLPWLREF
jgi:hypothetical protein